MFDHGSLDTAFAPAAIAVVGASGTPQKIGAVPVGYLRRFGFTGEIYPVNPAATEIQGLDCYPSLGAIGRPVDLAVLAVPAARARAVLEDAAKANVKSVVLFTSGYAEAGEEGRREQARLLRIAGDAGIRVLGPNCLGFINVRDNVYATFSPAPATGRARLGTIGMVSQSGAFGAYAYSLARARGLGLSYWISTGNEGDISVADCIAWLSRDPGTSVIMAYIEGCRDGEKLKRAFAMAHEAGKAVVVAKVGRTASGARAAASHTAALAGDDAIYDAVFRRYGVLRAYTVEEFFNIGYALAVWKTRPPERSLGILTISGGVGALMADEAEEAGLQLPSPSDTSQQRLIERIPLAGPRNPVDLTGQLTSDPGLLAFAAALLANERKYGCLLAFLAAAGAADALWPAFRAFAEQHARSYPDIPLAICALIGDERRAELESLGCLVFSDPSAAVRTIAAVCGHPPQEERSSVPGSAGIVVPDQPFNESVALRFLQQAGVPAVSHCTAGTEDEAVRAAERLGYPVALKILSADILHKSEIGGVALALGDARQVRAAFQRLRLALENAAPGARQEGVLVAPMVTDGVECILGVQRDPVFGPVVMFGLGGIFVETMRDVSFRLAPVTEGEARAMIDEVKAAPLLKGARGRPPADIDSLAAAIAALSRLAMDTRDRIASIDINPFAVRPAGQGALALDAVIVRLQQKDPAAS